ncbi:MAG: hypothetical protein IKC95_03870 [Oscillospiraceae bacterium]|nr:hypothetical protein [Oscillospiraceae bacterium]
MERITRFRIGIVVVLFIALISFFILKLYDLQIIQTGGSTNNITTFTTRTRVKAGRGDILDTNGNVLVRNRASYDLVINHYVLLTAKGTNDFLYQLVQSCQENNITYNENLPITMERPFVYTLDQYNSAWQNYFQIYLNDKELDSDITAPLLIKRLRDLYKIPAHWSEEDARRVIGLRYEMDLRGCVGTLSNHVFLSDVSDAHLSTLVEMNIPGLMVEKTTVREYCTVYASHILGFVGPMNKEQWEQYKNIDGYSMDTEIGQSGLEAAFEQYLHGVDGIREDTVTVSGELVSSRYIVEPKAGSNVEIAIDINLQRAAEEGLARVITGLRNQAEGKDGHDAGGGAVVAMDVKTGQVLVCASYPTYDLSKYFENYNEILQDPYDPLYNRALQGAYPPGSTYKMSMVVAGINSGTIKSDTEIYDKGVYDEYAPDFVVKCLRYTNYGKVHAYLTAAEALQVSCNYFFYDLGDKIALSAMDSTAKALGLGEPTGIELPENTGRRANAETKKLLYSGDKSGWYQADQITAAIGQSDNRFTPMQLCSYTAALANRGTRYKATFLNRVVSSDYRQLLLSSERQVLSTLKITDDAYLAYSSGMQLVTQKTAEWTGTAYNTFKNYPISVAAKTGTAQDISGASDNGAFVCYAPADNPQIAIAIYGEKAGHGSQLASIARDILDIYFEVGQIGDVPTFENKVS